MLIGANVKQMRQTVSGGFHADDGTASQGERRVSRQRRHIISAPTGRAAAGNGAPVVAVISFRLQAVAHPPVTLAMNRSMTCWFVAIYEAWKQPPLFTKADNPPPELAKAAPVACVRSWFCQPLALVHQKW